MVRITCPQCQRPERLCYCDSIRAVVNKIPVSIIQHPLEKHHPFNTGRMADLALVHSRLIVAEKLSQKQCQDLLCKASVLLYPDLDWLPPSPPLPNKIANLVVLDGNWRKSKKMMHLNPELQELPRLSLANLESTKYQIRLSSQPNSLATIEAIYHALTMQQEKVDDLLVPFQKMVELQRNVATSQKQN